MVKVTAELTERASTILHLVSDFRETFARHDADQWQALALHRFHMLRALSALVAFKEEHILVPILCAGDAPSASGAKELMSRNHDLQIEYDAFVLRWGLTSPSSVDAIYKAEAAGMISRIERQTRADVQQLIVLMNCYDQRREEKRN